MRPIAWWIVTAVFLTAPSAKAEEDLSGTWVLEAEELIVDLQQDAQGALTGTVSRKGSRFAIRGKVEAGVAKGIFHDDWTGTFFEARIQGKGLKFVILESVPDSTEYKRHPYLLSRKAVIAVTAGGRIGRMARHPAGFDLWIPDGWGAEENGKTLRLVPPAPESGWSGMSEVVLVMAVDLGAAPSDHMPDDPRVVHFLDNLALSMSGALRRVEPPVRIDSGARRGAFMEWATDAVDPTSRRCRAWVTILGRKAVALVASGPGMQLVSRTGDLRLVFVSLGFDNGGSAPALMRSWSFQSTTRFTPGSGWMTDWSRARTAPDRGCQFTLDAEGTFKRVSGDGAEQDQGRWATGSGALLLIRGNIREIYEYAIQREDDGMKLCLRAGDRGEIWIRE